MKYSTIILLIFLSSVAFSQEKTKHLYFQASNKTVSLYPFYKIFSGKIKPAFTIGGEIEHRSNQKSVLFQNAELTFYSHEMIGSGITLSTNLGYCYQTDFGLYADASLGIGTSIYSPARQNYVLDENGEYALRKNPIFIMLSVPTDLSLGYQANKLSFYLKYRYTLEGKFIGILPIIPTQLLSIGIKFKIDNKQ